MQCWRLCLGAFLAAIAVAASAQPRDPVLVQHPWVVPPPNPRPEAYFLDLRDGDSIETPFVLRFGLSGRGLAPAERPAGTAGHHHLLIDFPIPKDTTKPLPFTDQYLHFGNGEMQTILQLKPGTYTLALLLADADHVPYPVHSQPIRVTVTKHKPEVNVWKLWGEPHVEIRKPVDGERVRGPFRVNFHASGYNIVSATTKALDGHFRLNVDHRGKPPEVLEFTQGQTEVWLNPPAGDYTLRLELVSHLNPGQVSVAAKPVRVKVDAAK